MADGLSWKKSNDGHNQQMAELWTMTWELLATNQILQHIEFLANFIISNDLVEKKKMTQVNDKEINALMKKSIYIKVDDVRIV